MAGIPFPNAQISNPDTLIPKTASVLKRSVESEFRSDHQSIVVQFDVASAKTHQFVSISHSSHHEVDASI